MGMFGSGCLACIYILVREVWVVDGWVLGSGAFVSPEVGVHRVKIMICASVKITCTCIITHSLVF